MKLLINLGEGRSIEIEGNTQNEIESLLHRAREILKV